MLNSETSIRDYLIKSIPFRQEAACNRKGLRDKCFEIKKECVPLTQRQRRADLTKSVDAKQLNDQD